MAIMAGESTNAAPGVLRNAEMRPPALLRWGPHFLLFTYRFT